MRLDLIIVSVFLLVARAFELPHWQDSIKSLRDAAPNLESLRHNLEGIRDGANLDSIYHNLDALRQKIPNMEMPVFLKQFTDPIGVSPLLSLHRDLVQIESITGNESAVGQWLVDYLTRQNFTVETQPVSSARSKVRTMDGWKVSEKERFNILAYIGENRTTRTLISSHIDVVPPYWPYEVKGQRISGRGSVDAKGSVAAQIRAVEELWGRKEVGEGDVALLFVVGEETGGDGMRAANSLGLSWETVIFGEPTELKLASGHKGLLGFTVRAVGKASHSGYPELGINANSLLISALAVIDKLDLPHSEKLGNSTLNIGRMDGGVAANVIPADAQAQVTVRIASGTPDDIKEMVEEAVGKLGLEGLTVEFWGEGYGPIDIDCDIEGFDTMVVSYGTDIPFLSGDHKRYLYGPGSIHLAHSDHESLNIKDLQDAVNGYKKLLREALHPTAGKSVAFPDAQAVENAEESKSVIVKEATIVKEKTVSAATGAEAETKTKL